ncbi:unnamed protein product [Protopolystoma xenopodis]|uniref:Dynein heavy chain AAA module D4 domain-containing protein n=1 Tax=Protopolystoma xenopodis TaxID=117903 RepID=A0A3S5CJF0_9PLAT|nr:unnamed protein product [Protopolystoma xenopodis]
MEVDRIDMVLFNDALIHLGAIHRILRTDAGHALLIGVSGSGKHLLARLAAFIAGMTTYEISVTRVYRETEFREDLKRLFNLMSEKPDSFVFLLGDAQITDEGRACGYVVQPRYMYLIIK